MYIIVVVVVVCQANDEENKKHREISLHSDDSRSRVNPGKTKATNQTNKQKTTTC